MHADSARESRRTHRTAAAFEQYVSGKRGLVEGAAFFLDAADHLDDVLGMAVPGDIIFAPTPPAALDDARIIGYHGAFREPGDEMTVDERHVFELQDYLALPFVSIVGPTVVRHGSEEGVAAFLGDADTARESGVFVDQLLSSAVLSDSHASLVSVGSATDSLVRVHVTTDGEYRDGPDGLLLGVVGDERADIEASAAEGARRGRAFARIVDPRTLEADLDDRPWLERYLAALDVLRQWDGALPRPAISGFGGHLVPALDEGGAFPSAASADAPFLLTADGEEYILADPSTGRRFRLGVDAARVAECLIATADETAASALLAAELGRPAGSLDRAVREVRTRFTDAGVDLTAYGRDAG